MKAAELIELLDLEPLPEEGGFYRQTYKSKGRIPGVALPNHSGDRAYSTCIYYLITPEEFSGLHVVRSAEVFHFYAGDPVRMVQIDPKDQTLKEKILGLDLKAGQRPQVVVEAGIWQGTKLLTDGAWALLGCTVSPGFEFEDFKGGSRLELEKIFPEYPEILAEFTHR